jgi:hypothetical protein
VNSETVWCQELAIGQAGDATVNFKLDTGAEINTIPLSTVQMIKGDFHVKKTRIRLKVYSGAIIKSAGEVILPIHRYDKVFRENFVVMNQNMKPLLNLKTQFNQTSLR